MTCKDLMVGDFVTLSTNTDARLEVVSIMPMLDTVELADIDNHGAVDEYPIEALSGIPITPEILVKNGFIYKDALHNTSRGVWVCNLGRCNNIYIQFTDKVAIEIHNEISRKDDNGRADLVTFIRDWCEVLYVHELQRVLHICKIDKNIVL